MGTLQVVGSSHAPDDAVYSNGTIIGVVSAPGVPAREVEHRGIFRADRWPEPGDTLPVLVDLLDPSRFNILWSQVSDKGGAATRLAQQMAAQMNSGPAWGTPSAGAGTGGPSVQDVPAGSSFHGGQQFQWSSGNAGQVPQEIRDALSSAGLGNLLQGATGNVINDFFHGATGTMAQGAMSAAINSATPTGRTIDGKTETVISLTVNRPDGSIFDTQVTKSIMPSMLHYFSPGRIVQVVSPTGDENNLSIIITMAGH
jgi:hypothetical protein